MIIAVDASAIVAIILGEPEGPVFDDCLSRATAAYITPVNVVEAGLALVLRSGWIRPDQFDAWLSSQRIVEQEVSGAAALASYLTYGRGVHRAGLNLGDCFAYALARQLDAPLLYKGDDFGWTDIRRASQPT